MTGIDAGRWLLCVPYRTEFSTNLAAGYGGPRRCVLNEPAHLRRFGPCKRHRSCGDAGAPQPDLIRTMPISVSTIQSALRANSILDRGDLPVIRQCRDQAARLGGRQRSFRIRRNRRCEAGPVRQQSTMLHPRCPAREHGRSDEFMFDFQRRGRSSIVQAGNEGTIEPGYGRASKDARVRSRWLLRSRAARE